MLHYGQKLLLSSHYAKRKLSLSGQECEKIVYWPRLRKKNASDRMLKYLPWFRLSYQSCDLRHSLLYFRGLVPVIYYFIASPAVWGLISTEDPQIVTKSYIAGERHLFFKYFWAIDGLDTVERGYKTYYDAWALHLRRIAR